jgi:hypothetical protein
MGHRANYVVVERGARELYYSHWTANTLTRDLFWGPEWALPFVRRQERTEEWLDDIWCEGAALVDLDRKVLLLFGGEDEKYDVAHRRVYLSLLRSVWAGWEVRWAHEGLIDVVDHLGLARALVRSDRKDDVPGAPDAAGEWIESAVSVRWADGRTGIYALGNSADAAVFHGAELLSVMRRLDSSGHGRDRLAVPTDCTGGVHIDERRRQVDFWLASTKPEAGARAARGWPGWEVAWRHDDFDMHGALAEGRLTFDIPPEKKLLANIVRSLEYAPGEHRGVRAAEIAAVLAREGKRVEVNPRALVDAPQTVPVEERRSILARALAARAAAKPR